MLSRDIVHLYFQLYEGELKARDYVVSALAPFVSALTLLVGATIYFLVEWPSGPAQEVCRWVFLALFAIGAFSVVLGIGFSLAALWSREYGYVPGLGKIETWRKANEGYHERHPNEVPGLEARLLDGLANELASAAEQNRTANRARGAHAHRAKMCTAIALTCYAVGVIPFAVVHHGLRATHPSPPQTGSVPMTDKDSASKPVKPASTSTEPQKTPFPPKENLKEGHDKVTVKRDK